jgi:hypothetical protein
LYNTSLHDLKTYGQGVGSLAYAIDNSSTSNEVGTSQGFGDYCDQTSTIYEHAVQWLGTSTSPSNLGTLPNGWVSHAYGINALGTVAGDSTASADSTNCGKYPPHAFTRTTTVVYTQLDTNANFVVGQSRAYSINNDNPPKVVGIYNAGTNGTLNDSNADAFI